MVNHAEAVALLNAETELTSDWIDKLQFVGFDSPQQAIRLLREIPETEQQRTLLAEIFGGLLYALSESADSDRSVRNFQRFFFVVDDRLALLQHLTDNPRAVEILIRLFVGSQFLTEILLRHPSYFERLTQHKRLAEFKSREEFINDARNALDQPTSLFDIKRQLRSFHQWEILRIAACDSFGLMDLKSVTLQLSLLADAIVQVAIENISRIESVPANDFAVIAFGKLGGLELNYSSDIDLVFVSRTEKRSDTDLATKLINVLSEMTAYGFLYRVDMRLRPWGSSGPLVTTASAYADYFRKHAHLWERQALLKARTISGCFEIGDELLEELRLGAFHIEAEDVRRNIVRMKQQIETTSRHQLKKTRGVKGGPGGIRDIEFVVQYLQLIHGDRFPDIRRVGTLESLVYLSEANLIHAEEFRILSTAYVILRTVEHALQLMHNQPEYFLPESDRELAYLARRLDFPDAETFLSQYHKHTEAVKRIFDNRLDHEESTSPGTTNNEISREDHDAEELSDHFDLSILQSQLNSQRVVSVAAHSLSPQQFDIVIVGYDHLGDLPIICGLLFAYGFDIVSGQSEIVEHPKGRTGQRQFVNRFRVEATRPQDPTSPETLWKQFADELNDLLAISITSDIGAAQKRLIHRLAQTFQSQPDRTEPLLPVDISFERDVTSNMTILHISGTDVPGFLYELTNAISANGLSIERMTIQSDQSRVFDTLYVVDTQGDRFLDEVQQNRLRAAVVLIKHFTHLLPHAPNPKQALIHFRDLLSNLFEQADWLDQLQTLQQPDVLAAVARLLGYSDFLWEDFLRLQHQNLFPVITDLSSLQQPVTRARLHRELSEILADQQGDAARAALNEFKDRAMMRVDMRHILGLQTAFGTFSRELTAVAETIVEAAIHICLQELSAKYGLPHDEEGREARLSVCALGKCGGCELGYASDIELMFLYDRDGHTSGPTSIQNLEFYQRLVDLFRRSISTRQKRIFEIDLRLRPYANAGSLAVSLQAFDDYFRPDGPAWPFERQALVKLRPIVGDASFGQEVVELRDRLIYRGGKFDIAAMRAMREKQIRQLVEPGTFHAKLSPGGLVDCEYFVQAMQMTFGHLGDEIRNPNTRMAIKGLEKHGILTHEQRIHLRDAYRFLRRLIDGMRMVRGDATDLTIPQYGTEQFEFLARRLGIQSDNLHEEIERQTCRVIELVMSIEELIDQAPPSEAK